MNLRISGNQLPGHKRNVSGCSQMRGILCQAAAVHKMSAGHAQSCCPLIHHLDKCLLRACYVFRHGNRRIISRRNHNTFDQRFHCLNLSLLQKDLGTAHGFCISAGNHLICHFYFSLINSVKNQNQRHDFCNAGRTSLFIRLLLINNLSGRGLH